MYDFFRYSPRKIPIIRLFCTGEAGFAGGRRFLKVLFLHISFFFSTFTHKIEDT
jgi:hypothetical protein